MTQQELELAVAEATGEPLEEIQNRGFTMAGPGTFDYEPEPCRPPLVVDWDALDQVRALARL